MPLHALSVVILAFSFAVSVAATSASHGRHELRRASEFEHHAKKLLLFWAVGTDEDAVELIQQNVRTARESAGHDCCEVFLAHYKGGPEDWPQEWYNANVVGHIARKGFKFQLLQDAFDSGDLNQQRYDFVWVLDEDIELENVGEALRTASDSGALISGPALWQENRGVDWGINAQHPECRYRYTNVVEVIAPLMRTEALEPVLSDCEHCIHNKTVWGLDQVWCKFVAKSLPELVTSETACAIMDAASVNHLDWKTLGDKHGHSEFERIAELDQEDTQQHYPAMFVTRAAGKAYKCVKYAQQGFLQIMKPPSAAF